MDQQNEYYETQNLSNKTEAQILAEILCRREASRDKIVLPDNFWLHHSWKKKYTQRIIQVNKYLKVYSYNTILKAIVQQKWYWNLGNPKMVEAMSAIHYSETQAEQIKQKSIVNAPTILAKNTTVRTPPKQKTIDDW